MTQYFMHYDSRHLHYRAVRWCNDSFGDVSMFGWNHYNIDESGDHLFVFYKTEDELLFKLAWGEYLYPS